MARRTPSGNHGNNRMILREVRKSTRNESLHSGILHIDFSFRPVSFVITRARSELATRRHNSIRARLPGSYPVDEIGGFFEKRSMLCGIGAQGCALSSQIAMEGCRPDGSSRLAAVIANIFSV